MALLYNGKIKMQGTRKRYNLAPEDVTKQRLFNLFDFMGCQW